MVLTQIEACLNSRPLVPLPGDDDGIESLLLVDRLSLMVLSHIVQSMSMAHVPGCGGQPSVWRFVKWHHPSRNVRK